MSGLSYGDYLALDRVLGAQTPRSDAHDEMLFIVQHQTAELWMKLALHEMRAARAAIEGDRMQPAFKMLTRVARIFEQLNAAWDVLRTMTPSEYTRFRAVLGPSSGFQSAQYREIEFLAGNKQASHLSVHEQDPEVHARLTAALAAPSLYDATLDLLGRHGFDIATGPAIQAAWAHVYREPEAHWTLYELGEKLVDFEDYFRRWRFNHVTTVERIIGAKPGTGGTAGVPYLRRMLDVRLFPELWSVRTEL